MQAERALEPVLVLYVPVGQVVQAVRAIEPVLVLYVPARQPVQAVNAVEPVIVPENVVFILSEPSVSIAVVELFVIVPPPCMSPVDATRPFWSNVPVTFNEFVIVKALPCCAVPAVIYKLLNEVKKVAGKVPPSVSITVPAPGVHAPASVNVNIERGKLNPPPLLMSILPVVLPFPIVSAPDKVNVSPAPT